MDLNSNKNKICIVIFISAASSNTVQLQATAVARLAKDLQNKVNIKFKVS